MGKRANKKESLPVSLSASSRHGVACDVLKPTQARTSKEKDQHEALIGGFPPPPYPLINIPSFQVWSQLKTLPSTVTHRSEADFGLRREHVWIEGTKQLLGESRSRFQSCPVKVDLVSRVTISRANGRRSSLK